ncbi:hypothetical protein GLYMA_19G092232v4 [Glycine max]|nr:hypothetical protein GLYMA_19G092232v4 [Glycine max]
MKRNAKSMRNTVFKVMDEAVEIMDTLGKMEHIVGPLWLVILLLNAILANHITLEREIPDDIELKIEAAQLIFLTPSKEFYTCECYSKYIKAFLQFEHFNSGLTPFLNSQLTGQSWLKQRFLYEILGQQSELIEI